MKPAMLPIRFGPNDVRTMRFYAIVGIVPSKEKGYTTIHANGQKYSCTWNWENVVRQIEEGAHFGVENIPV